MARTVKCVATGEKGTSDIFYKSSDGKWFKSESVYHNWQRNTKYYKLCKEMLLNYLGIGEGEPFPTLLTKKLKEYKTIGYNILYSTIIENSRSIEWALQNKNFRNLTGKIMYIFAIISNHIYDVKNREIVKEKMLNSKPKNAELFANEFDIVSNPEVKNISQWLEVEE